MNSRNLVIALGTAVAVLVVFCGISIVLLLRQQAELNELRAHRAPGGEAPAIPDTDEKPTAAWSNAKVAVPLEATQSVNIVLGEVNQEEGLRLVYNRNDGATAPAVMAGVACRELTKPGEMAKIHFVVEETFKKVIPMRAWVEVEYFDASTNGALSVEYDGPKPYTKGLGRVSLKNDGKWKTATFELPDAQFFGRENERADFRIIATKPKVFIHRVTLKSM